MEIHIWVVEVTDCQVKSIHKNFPKFEVYLNIFHHKIRYMVPGSLVYMECGGYGAAASPNYKGTA